MAKAATTGSEKKPAKKKAPTKKTKKKKAPAKTKAKKEALSRKEQALAVVNKLKGKYKGKIFLGHEYTMPWMLKRLPTGILDLDIALNGGFPAGGFTMVYGPEGIGKNYLALLVMMHQQLFKGDDCNIAVISTEMPFDKTQAKTVDVHVGFSKREVRAMDRAYFDATGEHLTDEYKDKLLLEIGRFVVIPPTTAEEAFEMALQIIGSRVYDIVLIDSFGALLTEDDDDKDMEEYAKIGGASFLNSRFARKLTTCFAPDEDGRPNMTCVIGLNQLRDEMDRPNKYSPKTKETGGWALKHMRFVGIELTKLGKVKQKVAVEAAEPKKGEKKKKKKTKERVVGKTVGWKITKQKAGGHEGDEGDYEFVWSKAGVDRIKQSVRAAIKFGVITKSGSWYSYDGEQIGQGVEKTAEFIRKAELLQEIETETLRAAGIYCNYLYDEDE